MELINFNGGTFNICHFQGRSFFAYSTIFEDLLKRKLTPPQNVDFVTFFNNKYYAIFAQQLENNNIAYINGFDRIDGKWDNRDKVGYALRALDKCTNGIVIICDANDVLVNTFDGILEKFKDSGKRILFNGTTNNHPEILIDKVPNRDFLGRFRYFNAGCCIGYKEDLIKFYSECQKFLDTNPYNPWKSEQFILRNIFAKYLENNNTTVGYDYNCNIFQTFGNTQIQVVDGDKYRVL
jgi:hypothetical protein